MHAQCPSQWNGLGVRPKTAATLRKPVEHRCNHPNHRKLLEGPKPIPKPRKLQLCGYISTQTFSDVHGLCEYLFKAERRKVRVLYDYPPENDDELELVVGDVIEFLEEVEEGWWKGILKGRMGVFPSNFVGPVDCALKLDDGKDINDKDEKRKPASPKNSACQDSSGQLPRVVSNNTTMSTDTDLSMSHVEASPPASHKSGLGFSYTNGGLAGLKSKAFGAKDEKKAVGKVSPKTSKTDPEAPKLPPKPIRELAKVLYSYEAQNDDELSIKEGDTIVILTKEVEDKGWWKGELNGKVGVFPDNFVQPIRSEPDLLMTGHSSPQPVKPDRPDKPVKAFKPDLTREKPPASSLMGFNPQNQPLPPLPTDSTAPTAAVKGDQASDKPVSKVSPFGPQEGMSMMNAAGLGGRLLLTLQTRKQNGGFPVSLIAAQAAERAILNNSHANGGQHDTASTPSNTTPQPSGNRTGSSSDEGITLDSIESSEGKLKHPTADRARPPARRPPSHIGSPSGQSEFIAEVNSDSLEGSTSAVVHLNGHQGHNGVSNVQPEEKRTSIKDLTSKFNEVNSGPLPQVINLAGRPFSNGNKHSASSLNKDNLNKDDVDAKTDEGPSARSEISQKLEAEILELRVEVKKLREHNVTREEFNNLTSQMKKLQESMESNRAHYSKMVRDLMAEVDEEKKQRMTLQVEIDRLKKITTDLL